MNYVVMRELGQSDAVCRNYDLGHVAGNEYSERSTPKARAGIALDRAFARMGFDQARTARAFILPTVRAHMRNMGYNAPLDDALAIMVREWYNWDRIRKGELQQWPLKAIDNPLL